MVDSVTIWYRTMLGYQIIFYDLPFVDSVTIRYRTMLGREGRIMEAWKQQVSCGPKGQEVEGGEQVGKEVRACHGMSSQLDPFICHFRWHFTFHQRAYHAI